MYALLRAIAGLALRWYYRSIDVEGLDRIPSSGPVLLTVNHPNALVDAMLVCRLVRRRVLLTAKATLFEHPLMRRVLASVGVVPLVRAKDLQHSGISGAEGASRNEDAFRALYGALARGGCVLIFPEGISHDDPRLAPLRTGAARIALQALERGDVEDLAIVPIGLTFERKDAPRTRVLARVGEPLMLRSWRSRTDGDVVAALTAAIDRRLRSVTLNYESQREAEAARSIARLVARVLSDTPVGVEPPLGTDVAVAQRIAQLTSILDESQDASLRETADRLRANLSSLEAALATHHIDASDAVIAPSSRAGARFVVRELAVLAIAGPIALWGFVNHWLPFRAARWIGKRSVESAADPAMRTILAGLVSVLLCYAVQVGFMLHFAGVVPAVWYLASLPIAADINFRLRERFDAARARARTYLLLRRDPLLRERLLALVERIRGDAATLGAALDRGAVDGTVRLTTDAPSGAA